MKIIALDSSGLVASVAIMTEETLIAEYTMNHKKTHSQTLLPMLDEIVKMSETNLEDIDAIAIAGGPGSFTGLRIGSSTAKGLGLALDKPVISVPTVDALAYQIISMDAVICPLMDARRMEVYTGIYENDGTEGGFHVLAEQTAVPLQQIISKVNEIGRKVIYLGDGVDVYKEQIQQQTEVDYIFAGQFCSKQRAGAVGALAFEYFKQGKYTDAAGHVPVYLRLSQAEREKLEQDR